MEPEGDGHNQPQIDHWEVLLLPNGTVVVSLFLPLDPNGEPWHQEKLDKTHFSATALTEGRAEFIIKVP